MEPVRYRSGAKVNLLLRVGPPRADGFHDLVTLFAALDCEEELAFRFQGEGLRLQVEGASLGDPEENLVTRAIRLAARSWGLGEPGVGVTLLKSLPHQAGLGGGSANAAAALLAMRDRYRPAMPLEDLIPLGSSLGSDVPFFLLGGYAVGRGRGENLALVPSPLRLPVLVLKPREGIPTGPAYAELDRSPPRPGLGAAEEELARLESLLREGSPVDAVCEALGNDFHAPLVGSRPGLQRVLAALEEAGARRSLLSGSGSAVFGVFPDLPSRDRAREILEPGARDAGWTLLAGRTGAPGVRRLGPEAPRGRNPDRGDDREELPCAS